MENLDPDNEHFWECFEYKYKDLFINKVPNIVISQMGLTHYLSQYDREDYYSYMKEKLYTRRKSVFHSYEGRNQATFKTWLLSVATNGFIDWYKINVIGNQKFEEYKELVPVCVYDKIENNLHTAFNFLNIDEKIVLKAIYIADFSFEQDEISLIAKNSNKSIDDVYREIHKLQESVREKLIKREKVLDKINSTYFKINMIKQEILNVKNHESYAISHKNQDKLEDLQREYNTLEKRWSKLSYKYRDGHMEVRVPIKEVATLLGKTEGSINVSFFRIKKKLWENILVKRGS